MSLDRDERDLMFGMAVWIGTMTLICLLGIGVAWVGHTLFKEEPCAVHPAEK